MREIIQLKDGKEVKRYQSQHNASQETGLPQCNISACLNRHRRTCGGFTWEYAYNKVSLDLKRVEQLIGEGYLINEALFLLGIDYWYYSRHVSPERRKELLLTPPNNARPQRFAIRGEYAVACESLGSNNVSYACPGDLTDGSSASGVLPVGQSNSYSDGTYQSDSQ